MGEESENDDETYSVIFRALKHPIRRKILNLLAEKEMAFSEIERALGIDSGHLTYHLTSLDYLITTNSDNEYQLSAFGRAALNLLSNVEGNESTLVKQTKRSRHLLKLVQVYILVAVLLAATIGGVFYAQSFPQHTTQPGSTQSGSPKIQQALEINRMIQLGRTIPWIFNFTKSDATQALLVVEAVPANSSNLNAVGVAISYPYGLQYSRIGVPSESYSIADNGAYVVQVYAGDAFPNSTQTIIVWVHIALLEIQTSG
jgi:DNA-binding transcriptional ArsR family regulator